METHKCKLCFRTFANGRALGGHMKSHLAPFPLPPKSPFSSSSSSSTELESELQKQQEIEMQRDSDEKSLVYGLREKPKRSFKLVVQDRESETQSKTPTRRRSNRNRKKLSSVELPADQEPVSSVSDTSPEEDVAISLMMLSRDKWVKRKLKEEDQDIEQKQCLKERSISMKIIKFKKVGGKNKCEKCKKVFRSYRALCGHQTICFDQGQVRMKGDDNDRIFECPFCYKLFGSGQALGGHKRSHLLNSRERNSVKVDDQISLIDLNLPAPMEEDDYSVVSDA